MAWFIHVFLSLFEALSHRNKSIFQGFWNDNRHLTAFGVVGIGGLEYKFNEVPFTVSLDLMPYIYLNHWEGGNFIDGSLSIRYILK